MLFGRLVLSLIRTIDNPRRIVDCANQKTSAQSRLQQWVQIDLTQCLKRLQQTSQNRRENRLARSAGTWQFGWKNAEGDIENGHRFARHMGQPRLTKGARVMNHNLGLFAGREAVQINRDTSQSMNAAISPGPYHAVGWVILSREMPEPCSFWPNPIMSKPVPLARPERQTGCRPQCRARLHPAQPPWRPGRWQNARRSPSSNRTPQERDTSLRLRDAPAVAGQLPIRQPILGNGAPQRESGAPVHPARNERCPASSGRAIEPRNSLLIVVSCCDNGRLPEWKRVVADLSRPRPATCRFFRSASGGAKQAVVMRWRVDRR